MRRLAIRPGGIGDVILSIPALQHLWRGSDYLEVWTPARSVPLIRFADSVRAISATQLDLLGITDPEQCLMTELGGFDSIISWYGSNRPEFRHAVRELPFEFLQALPAADEKVHATDFFLGQVGADPGVLPQIEVTERRENYAVIHPFSGSPKKNWPIEKYRNLAGRLPMPVRWCAGPEDPPLPNSESFESLWDLATFLAGASLYIGNDSGITHLAAAVGTPVLAIFLTSNPLIWAPRGDHVRIVHSRLSAAI